MGINIERKLQNRLIEEGDLVIDSISPEESVAMLVVKTQILTTTLLFLIMSLKMKKKFLSTITLIFHKKNYNKIID